MFSTFMKFALPLGLSVLLSGCGSSDDCVIAQDGLQGSLYKLSGQLSLEFNVYSPSQMLATASSGDQTDRSITGYKLSASGDLTLSEYTSVLLPDAKLSYNKDKDEITVTSGTQSFKAQRSAVASFPVAGKKFKFEREGVSSMTMEVDVYSCNRMAVKRSVSSALGVRNGNVDTNYNLSDNGNMNAFVRIDSGSSGEVLYKYKYLAQTDELEITSDWAADPQPMIAKRV